MHAAVIEKLAFHKEIYALKELRHLRMIYHRHIEQPVIRHRIGCLSIARSIAHAHCHDLTFNVVRVDVYVHSIVESLKDEQYK